jgi:hypothetical protein
VRAFDPPRPGRTVLACRCGKALDLADMRRLPRTLGDNVVVRPIVCAGCAQSQPWRTS